jgi:transposase
MISFPANTDIFVCHIPVSFACGFDGMIRYCRIILKKEPLGQSYFMFINKGKEQIRVLWYDGQGFLLCTKRSSKGNFKNWPKNADELYSAFSFFDAQIIFSGGDPKKTNAKTIWKKIA